VTVTASNDDGDTVIKTSSVTGTVKDALPTLTTPTISSNDADNSGTTVREGDVLSAAASTRSDDTVSYQWKANGDAGGSNTATYTVLGGDEGKTITVTVTASNDDGDTVIKTSAATGTVLDEVVTANNGSVTTFQNTAVTGQLSATDADNDVTFTAG